MSTFGVFSPIVCATRITSTDPNTTKVLETEHRILRYVLTYIIRVQSFSNNIERRSPWRYKQRFAFKDQVGRQIRGLVFWLETDVLTEIFHQRSKWVSSVKVQRNFWSFSFGLLICVSPQYYKHPRLLWDTESKKRDSSFFFRVQSLKTLRDKIPFFYMTYMVVGGGGRGEVPP